MNSTRLTLTLLREASLRFSEFQTPAVLVALLQDANDARMFATLYSALTVTSSVLETSQHSLYQQ